VTGNANTSANTSVTTAGDLGRYELLFRFASGGMADVYAARMRGSAGFTKVVAIKRMQERFSDDEDFVGMFIDEGRLAAQITSPHVVSTLDLGRADDGSLFIAMELVVGSSVWELFRACHQTRSALPLGPALEIIAQAASGLHAAHEARTSEGRHLEIVHRDVSPQNILIDSRGNVKLSDFGIARAVERVTHTAVPEVKGKYGYCSPEQIDCADLDQRSDLFSLGTIAWELLTGQQLFTQRHPMKTMSKVLECHVPSLLELRRETPPEIAILIKRCLSRDPSERPQSAQEVSLSIRTSARAAGVTLGTATLAEFVQEHAGDAIQDMETRLRRSLSESGTGRETLHRANTPAAHQQQSGVSLRSAAVSEGSAPRSKVESPEGRALRPKQRLIVTLVVILVGAAIGAGLAASNRGSNNQAEVSADAGVPSTGNAGTTGSTAPTVEAIEASNVIANEPETSVSETGDGAEALAAEARDVQLPSRSVSSPSRRAVPRSTEVAEDDPRQQRRRAIRQRVDLPDDFPR